MDGWKVVCVFLADDVLAVTCVVTMSRTGALTGKSIKNVLGGWWEVMAREDIGFLAV